LWTDAHGVAYRYSERRHDSPQKAVERVNRENEKQRQWRRRYEAAQAEGRKRWEALEADDMTPEEVADFEAGRW
jgi:hypothetical protein